MSATTPNEPTATPQIAEHCGQCGAPAAPDQRYCVNCGFHRRNAPDPVSRYLSEASAARARVSAATAFAAQRRRGTRLGLRAVAMMVVLALIIGVLIGSTLGAGTTPARSGSGGGATGTQTAATHTAAHRPSTKLKNATGSSYLQQEQNLPNSVTP